MIMTGDQDSSIIGSGEPVASKLEEDPSESHCVILRDPFAHLLCVFRVDSALRTIYSPREFPPR